MPVEDPKNHTPKEQEPGATGPKSRGQRLSERLERSSQANSVVDSIFLFASLIIVDVLAFIALVAIAVSTFGVAKELIRAIATGDMGQMIEVITASLTVFIFIEVLSVSIHYIKVHHIEIKSLVDVTLAIIFRELWVGLFSSHIDAQEIVAFSILIAVLGFIRFLTVKGEGAQAEKKDDSLSQVVAKTVSRTRNRKRQQSDEVTDASGRDEEASACVLEDSSTTAAGRIDQSDDASSFGCSVPPHEKA